MKTLIEEEDTSAPGGPVDGRAMATRVETETETKCVTTQTKKASKTTFESLSKEIKELVIEKV